MATLQHRLTMLARRTRSQFNFWTEQIGAINGIAPLSNNGLVPDAHLPPHTRRNVQTIDALPIDFANGLVVNFDMSSSNVTAAQNIKATSAVGAVGQTVHALEISSS